MEREIGKSFLPAFSSERVLSIRLWPNFLRTFGVGIGRHIVTESFSNHNELFWEYPWDGQLETL